MLGGGAFWVNEHRHITWAEMVSPLYWLRRSRGEDLYSPTTAQLLHGNHALPEVALTFDDGPHPLSRGAILDILKRFSAKATFFDVGVNMWRSPDLLRRTLAEGNEIGNHSENHLRLPPLSARARHREINDADIAFCALTGQHLAYLRPPGDRFDDATLRDTRNMGYIVVDYNSASRDFETAQSPQFIAERTVARTENGSIILLHDYPSTAAALPAILTQLRGQGYRFVTISEMIHHLPSPQRQQVESFLQTASAQTSRNFGTVRELAREKVPYAR